MPKPTLDWKYEEGGQQCHSVSVGGRHFTAYVNLHDGMVYFSSDGRDPRFSGIPCNGLDEATEKALEILRKNKAELDALGL